MSKIQAFCYFKINIFILKAKTTPINTYYRFSSQTVSNKYGSPNLAKLIQEVCVFFTYTKDTHSTYLFIYLQTNSQVILFVSFQSLNRFLNTLCGNEFYWRLKIYKDFLETPGNIFNILCLQNAVRATFKRDKRKLVCYLHIFKPEILFTENRKWLYMRNFAQLKKY